MPAYSLALRARAPPSAAWSSLSARLRGPILEYASLGTYKQMALLFICERATRDERERARRHIHRGRTHAQQQETRGKIETIDETNTHLPEVVERELYQLPNV